MFFVLIYTCKIKMHILDKKNYKEKKDCFIEPLVGSDKKGQKRSVYSFSCGFQVEKRLPPCNFEKLSLIFYQTVVLWCHWSILTYPK